MSEFLRLEVFDFAGARVIGKEIRCAMPPSQDAAFEALPIPTLWDRCMADGTFDALRALGADAAVLPAYIDYMGEHDEATGTFAVIVGMLMQPGTDAPEGFAHRDLPATRMANGVVRGEEKGGAIYQDAGPLTMAAMAEAGHAYDGAAGYMIEVYDNARFGAASERGEPVELDNWFPIAR